ncbi:electron transfer flavoprotein subunit alpha/FixB family protein [Trueperella sp. LYQ143]|uniref:electron transfer flavoprotein subunit alpha/FixB family protein n=1 Tax=unclassified Trueperella TaxID=2630174 RepID=UPI00398336C0
MNSEITAIICDDQRQFGSLLALTDTPAHNRVAIVLGSQELAQFASHYVSRVLWLNSENALEAYTDSICKALTPLQPRIVVLPQTPAGRVIGGAISAQLNACIVSGALNVSHDGDSWCAHCLTIQSKLIQTLAGSGTLVALTTPSDIDAPQESTEAGEITTIDADVDPELKRESTQKSQFAASGIANAERIVSVGRGFKAKDDIALAQEFASAIGAEIGCSMPVADDLGWVDKSHYVGRSGQQVSPQLYIAVGISGAPQHMEGVRGAKTIVAINDDPAAAIFTHAHYGICGDLYEVLPALTAAVSK